MGLFDVFKQPQQQPQQPQPPETTVQKLDNAAAQEAKSPLDDFKELWKNDSNNSGSNHFSLGLQEDKIMEIAGKADFMKTVSPELVQKALSGDAGALASVINTASQQAFANSMIAATKVLEQAINKHDADQRQQLPDLVKRSLVSDKMSQNPLYQHEATRPLLAALENQLATKYPAASASEITEMAQKYIESFADAVSGKDKKQEPDNKDTAQSTFDFSSFL